MRRFNCKNDTLWPRARAAVAAIHQRDRRFPQVHASKALIHTWLAWQADPGAPMGLAIAKRYLDPQHPAAMSFVAWARRLFSLE